MMAGSMDFGWEVGSTDSERSLAQMTTLEGSYNYGEFLCIKPH
jgi:hypothetical protein